MPHAMHEAEEQSLAGWIVPVVVAAAAIALASAGHTLHRRVSRGGFWAPERPSPSCCTGWSRA
ncbi:hypothetical protein ACFWWT_46610 [Streptomyces sp. NPDC058676]|uniref:hypothetical protein n=1 Tax=unclassified Streptomyces TaxID=2593676 RepID=UPI00364B41C8